MREQMQEPAMIQIQNTSNDSEILSRFLLKYYFSSVISLLATNSLSVCLRSRYSLLI
jgi:hypothetical protein